ncbi:MAG: hypothetical protein ACYC91_04235 [Solirubrobacteraceae bacterium]
MPALAVMVMVTMTVYRTIHGPVVASPDLGHHLYVRQSLVDGRNRFRWAPTPVSRGSYGQVVEAR